MLRISLKLLFLKSNIIDKLKLFMKNYDSEATLRDNLIHKKIKKVAGNYFQINYYKSRNKEK